MVFAKQNVVNQTLSNSEENRSNGRVGRYVPEQGKSNPNASINTERSLFHINLSLIPTRNSIFFSF